MNAGVAFSAVGDATWLVLAGLLIGKPFGIFIFGWFAAKPMKFGMHVRLPTSACARLQKDTDSSHEHLVSDTSARNGHQQIQ